MWSTYWIIDQKIKERKGQPAGKFKMKRQKRKEKNSCTSFTLVNQKSWSPISWRLDAFKSINVFKAQNVIWCSAKISNKPGSLSSQIFFDFDSTGDNIYQHLIRSSNFSTMSFYPGWCTNPLKQSKYCTPKRSTFPYYFPYKRSEQENCVLLLIFSF